MNAPLYLEVVALPTPYAHSPVLRRNIRVGGVDEWVDHVLTWRARGV